MALPPNYRLTFHVSAGSGFEKELSKVDLSNVKASLSRPSLWNELANLDVLLRTNEKQHRTAYFFQKLAEIKATLKALEALKLPDLMGDLHFLLHASITAVEYTAGVSIFQLPSREAGAYVLKRVWSAAGILQEVFPMLQSATLALQQQLSQGVYGPFGMACTTVVARLTVLCQDALTDVVSGYNGIMELLPALPSHPVAGANDHADLSGAALMIRCDWAGSVPQMSALQFSAGDGVAERSSALAVQYNLSELQGPPPQQAAPFGAEQPSAGHPGAGPLGGIMNAAPQSGMLLTRPGLDAVNFGQGNTMDNARKRLLVEGGGGDGTMEMPLAKRRVDSQGRAVAGMAPHWPAHGSMGNTTAPGTMIMHPGAPHPMQPMREIFFPPPAASTGGPGMFGPAMPFAAAGPAMLPSGAQVAMQVRPQAGARWSRPSGVQAREGKRGRRAVEAHETAGRPAKPRGAAAPVAPPQAAATKGNAGAAGANAGRAVMRPFSRPVQQQEQQQRPQQQKARQQQKATEVEGAQQGQGQQLQQKAKQQPKPPQQQVQTQPPQQPQQTVPQQQQQRQKPQGQKQQQQWQPSAVAGAQGTVRTNGATGGRGSGIGSRNGSGMGGGDQKVAHGRAGGRGRGQAIQVASQGVGGVVRGSLLGPQTRTGSRPSSVSAAPPLNPNGALPPGKASRPGSDVIAASSKGRSGRGPRNVLRPGVGAVGAMQPGPGLRMFEPNGVPAPNADIGVRLGHFGKPPVPRPVQFLAFPSMGLVAGPQGVQGLMLQPQTSASHVGPVGLPMRPFVNPSMAGVLAEFEAPGYGYGSILPAPGRGGIGAAGMQRPLHPQAFAAVPQGFGQAMGSLGQAMGQGSAGRRAGRWAARDRR